MAIDRPRRRRPSMGIAGAILVACLVSGGARGSPLDRGSPAPPPPSAVPSGSYVLAPYVTEAAQRFGLPERWIWAVIRAESGGNPRAVSTAGAMGLMQLMPATWATLAARYGLGSDPFDMRANILGGAAYLREMLDRYGDPAIALAAYNAGPARVDDWRTIGRQLPAETITYVARIAPSVGTSGIASPAVVPPSWRDAALFTRRGTIAPIGGDTSSPPPLSSGTPTDQDVPAAKEAVRSTNLLFVPLSGRGAQ